MGTTKIEWADRVWNPITGCSPISEGCRNCYAKRMAKRLAGRCNYPVDDPFRPGTWHEEHAYDPLHWKQPSMVFVCSMGDLFHDAVNLADIGEVWETMRFSPQYVTFIVLTKRPERMLEIARKFAGYKCYGEKPLPNVWLGVSVENQATADERIPLLLRTPAAKHIVSYEPALGPVDFSGFLPQCECVTPGIDWLIAGGETGPGARPAHLDWFRSARDQCQETGVPFFLKSINAKHERELDGSEWNKKP